MKKATLIIALTLGVLSCKKEEVKPVTQVTTYQVYNYVCTVPMYSVTITNDTLICDAEGVKYEYIKISTSEFRSNRVYWKNTQNWTTWLTGDNAYLDNGTLYINL